MKTDRLVELGLSKITLPGDRAIYIADGAASPVSYASTFLEKFFGHAPLHPEADYYAICYGELCVYKITSLEGVGKSDLIAIWSGEVPDCDCDEMKTGDTYTNYVKGEKWEAYTDPLR